jgi:phage shock protein C
MVRHTGARQALVMTTALPPTPEPTTSDRTVPPVRRQLRRSSDKMIGGVCGGLAEYSAIDPLLWRVGFVALTLAGGSGVLVYLLLWVLMPPAPRRPEDRPGRLEEFVERMHTSVTGFRATPPR